MSAKAAIYDLIAAAAAEGTAVLIASSDTKELTMCCDRVLVMTDGVVSAEFMGDDLTETTLVSASLGVLPVSPTAAERQKETTS